MMSDPVYEKLEQAALGALEDYHAYRTYQGENPKYLERARLGIPVLSTYGRVRGTRANERQLALIERRFTSGDVTPDTPLALAPMDSSTSKNLSTERVVAAKRSTDRSQHRR
jgi:hypothetical protein